MQYDADLHWDQETKLRRLSHMHGLELDIQYGSSSQFYKRLKAHEVKVLPGFPVQTHAQASLRRTSKGPISLLIHQPVHFRLFAAARFGDALVRIMAQQIIISNARFCRALFLHMVTLSKKCMLLSFEKWLVRSRIIGPNSGIEIPLRKKNQILLGMTFYSPCVHVFHLVLLCRSNGTTLRFSPKRYGG